MLLSIFFTVTGIQVFFILRDLKKALDRLNKVLDAGENIIDKVEKPVETATSLVSNLVLKAKAIKQIIKKEEKAKPPKQKRFYKRTL